MTDHEHQEGKGSPQDLGSGAQEYADLKSPEHAEAQKPGFELHLDREKIATSETIPEGMKEWLLRLPESLNFSDQIVLIVGENGSGKTQFAKAVDDVLGRDREGSDIRSYQILLDKEEPAVDISQALTLAEAPQGNLLDTFIEGSEIMYKSREWAQRQARLRASGQQHSSSSHQLSSRQLFEQSLEHFRSGIDSSRNHVFGAITRQGDLDPLPAVGGDVLIIFDEPEQGLSPRRQMELSDILTNFAGGDTMLVPTNNIALYLSDLPRLDLEFPERGIHRPSDYGEHGVIEFSTKSAA